MIKFRKRFNDEVKKVNKNKQLNYNKEVKSVFERKKFTHNIY